MNYKPLLILFFLISCAPIEKTTNIKFKESFKNSGFALIYNENLFNERIVSKKIDSKSLIVFQKNLKPKTNVKITNMLNNKSIIATVGDKSKYPIFYNSVISKRISEQLELDSNEPYVRILQIDNDSTFITNKSKTFDEERNVAAKAPVVDIGIKDLTKKPKKKIINVKNKEFNYVIKIADFYYEKTAYLLKKKIENKLKIKRVKINELSKNEFRVYLGPYDNLNSLKNAFDQIQELQFENIEILKI